MTATGELQRTDEIDAIDAIDAGGDADDRSTTPPSEPAPGRLALRRTLAARLLPLAVLLALVIATAAPLAYLALTLDSLRIAAQARAQEIARELRREVEERPILWRYGSAKLLHHLGELAESAGLLGIAVIDQTDLVSDLASGDLGGEAGLGLSLDLRHPGSLAPIPLGADNPIPRALWVAAPLQLHGETVAQVWVAADPQPALRGALRLLLGFGLLGLGLGALVYWLPIRAITRAEARIGGLIGRLAGARGALQALNATLEEQVAARSSELRAAYEALRHKEERLRGLSGRALALQEAERRVIARELHDSAGQALTAIRIHLQLLAESAEQPEVIRRLAEKTQTITAATLEEIRRAVTLLGPAILDDVGLPAAIERLCDDLREDGRLAITSDVDLGPGPPLTPALESAAYRLVQESLTNIARHAAADTVEITIVADAATLTLTITDDGRGFDPQAALAARTSHGLTGMRERTELLGGDLEIASRPGEGTTILARLPRLAVAADGDDSALLIP